MKFSDIVTSHTITSEASPLQYEGVLSDGRVYHFKYRFGYATLRIAKTYQEIVGDVGVSLESRSELDAWMSKTEYEVLMVDMIHLHNKKYGDTITVEA
jgi:hypothetical protein